jgi:iron(III) transport system ATP-binding protein
MTVEILSLAKFYNQTQAVVEDVSLRIEDGELMSLLGPSGCGKTTLLRMVAGLETPDRGLIKCGGEIFFDPSSSVNLPPHRRGLGMVFQSYALWPHMTVAENVGFALKLKGFTAADRADAVKEALNMVRLPDLGGRYPHELSGGQQQRVARARALAQKPRVLLLDEPLSNLDAKLREEMRGELKALQRRLRLTMIYVTHDRLEALELSHRMAILERGRLVQCDTPDNVVRAPASPFVEYLVR